MFAFNQHWAVMGFVRFRNGIDRKSQTIWRGIGSDVVNVDIVVLN
jgi:hypothetical protein